MAHGATRKIRRVAERDWLDLRGLDKRQQRRVVRREARSHRLYVSSGQREGIARAVRMALQYGAGLHDHSRVFVKGSVS